MREWRNIHVTKLKRRNINNIVTPYPLPPPKKKTKKKNPHKAAQNTVFVINKDHYITDAIKISHVQCKIKESLSDAPFLNLYELTNYF